MYLYGNWNVDVYTAESNSRPRPHEWKTLFRTLQYPDSSNRGAAQRSTAPPLAGHGLRPGRLVGRRTRIYWSCRELTKVATVMICMKTSGGRWKSYGSMWWDFAEDFETSWYVRTSKDRSIFRSSQARSATEVTTSI